jgi:hypothetical protein
MQGLPLKDPEGYQPLLPNSLEGSLEGVLNSEVASEVGSTHSLEGFRIVLDSLEAFRLPPNLLLSIRQDAHFLWMNSTGEIIVVESIGIPTRPNAISGLDDSLFQSESFRTPAHTIGICNPSYAPLNVRGLYGNLGASLNQPMASQMPETYVTYMVTLDHFTGTTNNITTVSNQLLVGSHSILPLQIAHSTMVP